MGRRCRVPASRPAAPDDTRPHRQHERQDAHQNPRPCTPSHTASHRDPQITQRRRRNPTCNANTAGRRRESSGPPGGADPTQSLPRRSPWGTIHVPSQQQQIRRQHRSNLSNRKDPLANKREHNKDHVSSIALRG
jgi:hypothetical protein